MVLSGAHFTGEFCPVNWFDHSLLIEQNYNMAVQLVFINDELN